MGKFGNKFLDAFNLKGNNDDDYDDDDYYEDDDFLDDDNLDDYDDYDDDDFDITPKSKKEKKAPFFEEKPKAVPAKSAPTARPSGVRSGASAPSAPATSSRLGQQEVCIFKPSSIEDSREITETLLLGKAVVINFEGLHVEISQRIIDFISGSCYALDGNLQKISNYIFIATPNSVDISGDFQDLFNGDDSAFDIAGFKSPLL